MLCKEDIANKDKYLRLKLNDRLSIQRDKERSVYFSKEGKTALARLIKTGKIFDKISTNEGEIAIHNLVIGILEECGFLDEPNLNRIIDFLFTLPLIDKEIDAIGGN